MDITQVEYKRKQYALKHTLSYLNDLKNLSVELNTTKASDAFKNIDENQDNIKKALTRLFNPDLQIPPEIVRDFAIVLYEYYDKRSRWQEWLELGHLALEACQQLLDTYSMGEAYPNICNNLGRTYRMLSNYEKAIELYKEALDKSLKSELKSDALVNMADIYRLTQKYDKALQYAERAIETAGADKNRKAKGLEYQGLTYRSLKKYDQAIDYLQAALYLRKEAGNFPRLAVVMEFLSTTLGERGDVDSLKQAEVHLQSAIEIATKINDKNLIARCNYSLALVYIKKEKYEKAINIFLEICNYMRDITFRRAEVCFKIEMAYCYIQCNRLKEATVHAQTIYKYRNYLTPDDRVNKSSKITVVFMKTAEYHQQIDNLSEADIFLQFANEFNYYHKL